MEPLLQAILDNDCTQVTKFLKANPTLATELITEPRLHQFHWIYVGDTALHLAAAGHRYEIVKLLLAARADPNAAKNHRNSTPLHYAADGSPDSNSTKQIKTIQTLLTAGAELHAQDKNGATPLHRAVRTRCAQAVKFLLEQGANPTLKNKPGSTPFHLAVQNTGRGGSGTDAAKTAQRQIIQHFLTHGISPKTKDAKGKSVLDSIRSEWIRDLFATA